MSANPSMKEHTVVAISEFVGTGEMAWDGTLVVLSWTNVSGTTLAVDGTDDTLLRFATADDYLVLLNVTGTADDLEGGTHAVPVVVVDGSDAEITDRSYGLLPGMDTTSTLLAPRFLPFDVDDEIRVRVENFPHGYNVALSARLQVVSF